MPSEPLPELLDPADRLAFDLAQRVPRRGDGCNDDGFAAKSGDALVAHIRTGSDERLNRLFSDAPGSVRFAAFRARNMVDVAEPAASLATAYSGANATSLAEVLLFLRAGYYVAFFARQRIWIGRAGGKRSTRRSSLHSMRSWTTRSSTLRRRRTSKSCGRPSPAWTPPNNRLATCGKSRVGWRPGQPKQRRCMRFVTPCTEFWCSSFWNTSRRRSSMASPPIRNWWDCCGISR